MDTIRNPRLQLLERKLARQTPERKPAPADSSGLGAAIEALIQQRVDEALAEERERRPPAQVRRLTDQLNKPAPVIDYRPPVEKPKPSFTTIFHRDGAGRIFWMETLADGTDEKFITEVTGRDGLGQILGLKTIPPSESRNYKPGKPRGR